MPYIKDKRRTELNPLIDALMSCPTGGLREGDIAYIFSRILGNFVIELGSQDGASWLDRSRPLLILDAVKGEWRRRCVNQYEDIKIKENGDVPEFEMLAAWAGYSTPADNARDRPIDDGNFRSGPTDDVDNPIDTSGLSEERKGI